MAIKWVGVFPMTRDGRKVHGLREHSDPTMDLIHGRIEGTKEVHWWFSNGRAHKRHDMSEDIMNLIPDESPTSQLMWKIHSYDPVYGLRASANNNKFYSSYQEAEDAARSYVEKDPSTKYVIFRTCALVEAASPPIKVTSLL